MSSARKGWTYTAQIPVEERESPNKQVPYVSAHVRVYWPENATDEQVLEALKEAYEVSAYAALASKHGFDSSTDVWTDQQVKDIYRRARVRMEMMKGLIE